MRARFAFVALLLLVSMPAYADPPKLAIFDFELSDDNMAEIARLARPDGRIVDWAWSPQWDS